MQDKLRQIMSEVFKVPVGDITDETKVETVVSWDSLNHINLVLALEQEFSTTFTPEEIVKMFSFQEILQILRQKTQFQTTVKAQPIKLRNLIKLPNIFWGLTQEELMSIVRNPGEGAIPQGQFSLAVDDGKAFMLIRDRLGLNKLFYYIDQENHTVITGNYLAELVQMADKNGVYSVPAGHYVRIDKVTLQKEVHCYYDISEQTIPDKAFDVMEFQGKIKTVLDQGFEFLKTNFKDSEYFVCLSGGLDSTVIMDYAKRFLSGRVKAVTFSYASADTVKKFGHVIAEPPAEFFKDPVLSEDIHRAHRLAQIAGMSFIAVCVEKKIDQAQLDQVIVQGQDWRDFNVHCAWVNYLIAHHIQRAFPRKPIIFLTGDLMNEFVADYTSVDYKNATYYPQPRIAKDRLRKFFVYGLDAGDRELGVLYSPMTYAIQPYALVAEMYLEVPGTFLEDPDSKHKLNSGLLADQRLLVEVADKKIRAQVGGRDGGTLGLFHDTGITENILKERWGFLFSDSLVKFISAGRYRH